MVLLGRALPNSISVRTELPADLWPISGVAAQISQMLLNLCINARDAMPDGGVLTIAAANPPFKESATRTFDGQSGRYVRLTVSDTGIGIPAQAMDRIFDPSFTAKEPGAGRGRGLFTVLSVIRSHEGMIHVESSPGCGSRFEILLPAFDVSMKPSLLIAEADADLRHAYNQICSARGFEVRTTADGVGCLNKLAEATPHVLIVDLDIPWGGGDGVLACLRDDFADSRFPVVIVTGFDSLQILTQRSGILAQNCFPKPLRPSAVLNCVCGSLADDCRFDLGGGSDSLDRLTAF